MRILFFIGGLTTGGAERQITLLANGLAQRGHKVTVVTIYSGGQYWEWLRNCGSVKLLSLFEKKTKKIVVTGWQLAWAAVRLRRIIKLENVTLTYSALNLSNLIAWFAVVGIRHVNLVWGSRASSTTLNWKDSLPFYLSGFLSFSVPLLIANSQAGLGFFEANRYKAKTHIVIPNGIDTDRYKFNHKGRIMLRDEWSVSESKTLIGLVGRLTPLKDHPTFLKAASLIAQERNDVCFVCVGDGKLKYRESLHRLSKELGLINEIIWAGERTDMHNVYSALDIATSSSYSEAFPNCVGEAMACGVPCVVTDVGDSALIVDETGAVVIPRSPEQLAESLLKIVNLNKNQRISMGQAARARIENNFSVASAVIATEDALLKVSGKQTNVST